MYKYKEFISVPFPGVNGSWDDYSKAEQAEFARVNGHAKKHNTRVGRTFRLPCADSYAYYQVIGETAECYEYQVLDVGDAWTDVLLGEHGTFPKDRIDALIDREEALRKMFSK